MSATTSAGQLYKDGKLQEAIDAQIAEVRNHPGDQNRRLFLFELLVFAGDLDKAARQADALRYDDPELVTAFLVYRRLLDSERARRQAFEGGPPPKLLAPPPEHVRLRIEALGLMHNKDFAKASDKIKEAIAATPAAPGTLNDKPFTQIRDADDLFSGVLEVMVNGFYYWLPLENVASVSTNGPKFPRDLIAAPAQVEMISGDAGDVILPVLYPGSYAHKDPNVRLGRATDWRDLPGGAMLGAGLRTFILEHNLGEGEPDVVTLLDWRELAFQVPEGAEQAPAERELGAKDAPDATVPPA